MKKTIFIVLALVAFAAQFAGADTITALGLPHQLADILFMGGASMAFIIPVLPEQTGMVIAYKNTDNIADLVMPVKKNFSQKLSFMWKERNLADGFSVPDTEVGRSSRPNSMNFKGELKPGLAVAYGLLSEITQEDIDEQGADNVGNLVTDTLQALIDAVLLGRELRVAGIVQKDSNYLDKQVVAVDAAKRFDAVDSDPIKYIRNVMNSAIVRPNVIGMSADVWEGLATNPTVVSAALGNDGKHGVATRQRVAELLEVKQILVGSSLVNTSKPGQDPNLSRCWGNFLWGHYQSPVANATTGLTWGMTAQIGERYAATSEDPNLGLKGGFVVKAGMYQADLVTAKGAGFLLKNPITPAT